VALARLLRAQGDASAARDQWRAALAIREDVDGLVALAETSRLSGDKAGEQKALERLSQLDPSGAEWKRLAEIRLASGDLEGAEKALRRAQARDPKDPKASLALGRVVLQLGRSQEALELLRAAGPEGMGDRQALERRLNVEQPSRGDVAAIQRAVGVRIDRTYRARLKELPRLAGRLGVRVTVDGAGGATLVEVLEDSVHDEDVRACAYWNLRDAAYPAGKPGRYSFSFTLRPGR
jgi:tetratricopeptide (TPR) repeat protein